MTWAAILVTSAGCYLLKLAGLLVPRAWLEHPMAARVAACFPSPCCPHSPRCQTFAVGTHLVVDARLAGVAAAVVALLFRAPFLVVVFVAAATAAAVRALG